VADTPEKLLSLGEDGLTAHIRRIGLFKTKAKNILATCQILLDKHGGEVPRNREALEALPGVGRKTANVVLNTAFGDPPSPSTPTSSGWPTAPAWPRARPSWKWKESSCATRRPSSARTPTTG
jgi:hypothetical protein